MKILITGMLAIIMSAALSLADPYYHFFEQTTSILGSGGVYMSSVYDVTNYSTVDVNVTASHDSASNGLKINFVRTEGDCSDFIPGVSNMDYTANGSGWTYTAGVNESYSASVRGNCAWVTYTNSGTNQSSFELTIFGTR